MWARAQSADREFWLKFLAKYKSFRFLWDSNDRCHTHRGKREMAYLELAEMAKVIEPKANILYVRHRINSFRTSFKRETNKVEAAKAKGQIYEPSLFYYDTMRFLLEGQEQFEEDNATWDNDDSYNEDPFSSTQSDQMINDQIFDNELEANRDNDVSDNEDPFCNVTSTKSSVQDNISQVKIKSEKNHKIVEPKPADEIEYSQSSNESYSSQPPSKRKKLDQFELIGKRIADHLRNMEDDQCLIAEKIVSDVCFYGRMKVLTMQSAVNIGGTTSSDRKC